MLWNKLSRKEVTRVEDKLLDELEEATLDLLAEMHSFSKPFLKGLSTKSQKFQDKFFEIIDDICEYLDTDEEQAQFQKYIEENHSYDKPGNILYSSAVYFGGQHDNIEKLKEKFHFHLLGLFDDFEAEDVMVEVPHIVVCISSSNQDFIEEDMKFIENLISFERVLRGFCPAKVTTILNTANDRENSCYVAGLK